jgi:hypothetical protein
LVARKREIMPASTVKKEKAGNVATVKKMKDYSKEPAFKKKAADAIAFLKKNGLPKTFKKKGK